MNKKTLLYLASSIGGGFIALGSLLVTPPDLSALNKEKNIKTAYAEGISSDNFKMLDDGSKPRTYVEFKLRLTYPSRVEKDSTILVQAIPEITNIYSDDSEDTNSDYHINSITDSIKILLENGYLGLKLNLPSAKISPDILEQIPFDKASSWSVYFPIDGLHEGVVSEVKKERKWGPYINLRQNGEAHLAIEVYEPLFSTKNLFSFTGIVLGPLVSIPGIFAFLRERRKDKEEKASPPKKRFRERMK